ncbi:unnamed protein product [Blepharisma stoltei]|uniref:Lipid-binding serum glycoprotein C-terminal domain-containing protein n=1 Tax=Blepharisma stoltei TaxID=1481888 RepID=A0AAU9K4X2_9CILI|nr:unnamed protein product [Blepharisma stoltei]
MACCSIIFLSVIALCSAAEPAVRVSVAQSALQNLKNEFISYVVSKAQTEKIPDVNITSTLSTYIFTNITLSQLELSSNNTNIIFNPSKSTISLSVTNFTFALSMNVQFRFPFAVTGTMDITFTNGSFVLPISIGDSNGKINFQVGEIDEDELASLKVSISTNNRIFRLIQFFEGFWPFNKLAGHSIKKYASTLGESLNPGIEKILSKLSYTYAVTNYTTVDYHFLDFAIADEQHIKGDINGTFYLTSQPKVAPQVTQAAQPPAWASDEGVRIQFTEYFLNTYFWSIQTAGLLNYYLIGSQAQNFPLKMTTTGLVPVVPNLSKAYGSSKQVDVSCNIYQAPVAVIGQNVNITANLYCDFIVHVNSTTTAKAFRTQMTLSNLLSAYLENTDSGVFLYGEFDELAIQFSNFQILNSNVGTISSTKVAAAFSYSAYSIVMKINSYLMEQGVKLPLPDGVMLTDEVFITSPGAVELGATPDFSNLMKAISENK